MNEACVNDASFHKWRRIFVAFQAASQTVFTSALPRNIESPFTAEESQVLDSWSLTSRSTTDQATTTTTVWREKPSKIEH